MRRVAATLVLLAAARAGAAGSVGGTVTVERAAAGASPSDVIVYVVGFEEAPAKRAEEIRQKDKQFEPELVAITRGQEVVFPNADPFFHNVFSPSSTRKFDLGQYPEGERRGKRFPQVGIVEVFCNIHPAMAATILVLPNRRFARAAADGTFRIDGVPPGRWTVYAYSRRAPRGASAPVEVRDGEATSVSLSLSETRTDFSHPNKFGERYRDPEKYR